jgi:hypothetical protein
MSDLSDVDPAHAGAPYRTPPRAPAPDPLTIPYDGQTRMALVIAGGLADAELRIDPHARALLAIDVDDEPGPRVRVTDDEIRVEWSLSLRAWLKRWVAAAIHPAPVFVLPPAVEWALSVRGGVSHLRGDLAAGSVSRIEIAGGASHLDLSLAAPRRDVPIRVSGGASHVHLRRPAEVGLSLAVSGGITGLRLDDQVFDAIGGGARLNTPGVDVAVPRYALEICGGASGLTTERVGRVSAARA